MKKIMQYVICFFIFSAIWVIFNEDFSLLNIIIGGSLGLMSIYITNKFLMSSNYVSIYKFNFIIIFKYSIFIIYKIYYSGIVTIKKILLGQVDPSVITIKTRLQNDLYINLLANSITLTPGTVTISKKGNEIMILTIMSHKGIISSFEKIFMRR